MLTDYIRAAMGKARYEILEDDGSFYGEIPGFRGVWANEKNLEACRKELQSVLEDWMMFRLGDGLRLPVVKGINLNVFLVPKAKPKPATTLKPAQRKAA